MKSFEFIFIFLLLIIPVKSIHSEPESCSSFASFSEEKDAVYTLQEMYDIQVEMEYQGEKLKELNNKNAEGYDPEDIDSFNAYNDRIAEYNMIVGQRNDFSSQYAELKDSFNSLVDEISPSENISFISCINRESLSIESATNRLNIEALTYDISGARNELRREREKLERETKRSRIENENLERDRENYLRMREDLKKKI